MVLPWYENGCLRDHLKKVPEVIQAEDGVFNRELEKWVGQWASYTSEVTHIATVVANCVGLRVSAQ